MHSIKRDSASGKLLKMFVLNRDAFLSGEDAAQKLGVSRTAVWKAVEALRKEGFEIEGSTNRGYRLRCPCEVLHPALIESALEPFALSVCGGKIEVFDSIDSTNTEAKRRLSAAMGGHYCRNPECRTRTVCRQGLLFACEKRGVFEPCVLPLFGRTR